MNEWKDALQAKMTSAKKNQGEISAIDANEIVEDFLEILRLNVTKQHDQRLYNQVETMVKQITTAKKTTIYSNTELLEENFIPKIAEELRLVVKHTEDSTNKILDIFDEICGIVLKANPPTIKDDLMSKSAKILEACNFQDIIGQRIKNVTSNLISVESLLLKILNTIEPEEYQKASNNDPDANLLNGPPRGKNSPSQKEIDDLFDSA